MSLLAGIRVTRQAEEDESASFVCANGFIWSSKTTIRSRPSCGADQSVSFGTNVVDTRTCSFSKIPFSRVPFLSGAPEMNSPSGEAGKFFRSRSSCNACFVRKRSMILLTLRRLISNAYRRNVVRRQDAFGRFLTPPPNQSRFGSESDADGSAIRTQTRNRQQTYS
jgi:hypothetical protein